MDPRGAVLVAVARITNQPAQRAAAPRGRPEESQEEEEKPVERVARAVPGRGPQQAVSRVAVLTTLATALAGSRSYEHWTKKSKILGKLTELWAEACTR